MRLICLIASLALVGCPGRPLQSTAADAGTPSDAGPHDAGREIDAGEYLPDAGSPDGGAPVDGGGACALSDWHLETRPIESATPLFPTPSRIGATEQLDVVVHLNSSCERLSFVEDVGYSGNATDFIGLVAHVWTPATCIGPARLTVAHRVFTISYWGNMRVVVADRGVNGDGQLLIYEREQCTGSTDCSCWSGSPRGSGVEGDSCRTDCSCAQGLSCLCAIGVATAEPCGCARPCDDFLDCAAGERCGGTLGRSCVAGSSCPCPDGFDCAAQSCADRRTPDRRTCGCDADCGAGELCTASGQEHRCLVPCWRDADCPSNQGLGCVASLCQLLE